MNKPATGAVPRAVAARALDAMLTTGRNLDSALAAAGLAAMGDRDRALASALAYGAARTHLRNRLIIDMLASKPFRRRDSVIVALISVGIYALTESRRPDYAVVSATVEAAAELGKAPLKRVVNALLRRYLRERDALLAAAEKNAEARWQHPQWFIDSLRQDWPDDWQEIVAAGNAQAPMWLRINLAKTDRAAWLQRLQTVAATPAPACATALMLNEPLPVDQLPGFREGECSVQDLASQAVAPLLDLQPGLRVLDACAAPGGKATHMLESCPGLAELVALDESADRLERVEENLQRLGQSATLINGDVLQPDIWWDGRSFDRILLDAPCSATGVIRRHPDIRYLRQPGDIAPMAARQLAMLESLWRLLKPGGLLLYTTCSVLRAENDQLVSRFIAKQKNVEVVAIEGKLVVAAAIPMLQGLQLLPGRADNDGFYYALMRRPESDD